MSQRIPNALRTALEAITNEQCEYCRKQSYLIAEPLQIDHVIPTAADGKTELTNLCFACARCNLHKGATFEATDAETGETVTLFHPRSMDWNAHFEWVEDGLFIGGKTAIGRATIATLKMNNAYVVRARLLWMKWDMHPPK